MVVRELNIEDEDLVLEMIEEINNFDNNFEGLSNFKNIDDFHEFLLKIETNKHQELLPDNFSSQNTYCLFDEGRLIGGFNLRHNLVGNLINHGGNIGYLIRPSERRKGYGTKMLAFALVKAKELGLTKVLVSCEINNIGSSKVIENNKGIYENDYYDKLINKTFKRYWINLE